MKNIAILASGSGSNAENIIRYFQNSHNARVSLVLSNRPGAGVLDRATGLDVPIFVFSRNDFYQSDRVLKKLQEAGIDYLVLAGFLWLIPTNILDHFTGRIINIHPALLPKYGGKGMYGDHVHRAVVEAGENETGITIHHVNEHFDEGTVIFQAKVAVTPEDTPQTVADKVHQLEYLYFPSVIEEQIKNL